MRGRGIRAVVLASSLLALAPAVAAGEAPWLAPETVSAPGERTGSLSFAVAPSGDAVAVWAIAAPDGKLAIRAATRDARGPWADPKTISTPESAPADGRVGVAIGPGGDVIVTWLASASGAGQAAVRVGATGAWRAPEALFGARGGGLVAFEPTGTLLGVWQRDGAIVAAARPPGSATWGEEQVLATSEESATLFALVSNPSGQAAALWRTARQAGAVVDRYRVAVRSPGESFSAPDQLSIEYGFPSGFDVGPDGTLIAMRLEDDPGGNLRRIQVASRPPGGPFSPFVRLTTGEGVRSASPPALEIDVAGHALAAWTEGVPAAPPRRSSIARTVVAEREPGGGWTAPHQISERNVSVGARGIAVNHSGGALVVMRRLFAGQTRLEAAVRPGRGQPFGPPERVTPFFRDFADQAQGGIDGEGIAAIAYLEDGAVRSSLRTGGTAGKVKLTAGQLRTNQRISQAALRRATAIEARLAEGLTAADIRPGALGATAFAANVQVSGAETGALSPPGTGRPLVVSGAQGDGADAVRLTAAQLRINQRISQAGLRRANRLADLFDGHLTGADIADGAIRPEHLAPGLAIASASPDPQIVSTGHPQGDRRRQPVRVSLSAAQLRINQRIAQAAVRRLNSLVARLELGLPGSSFAPGSIRAADLAPELRR